MPAFLTAQGADDLLDWLLTGMRWEAERLVLFGRERPVPRLVAWCGEPGVCYRYSNRDHQALGWPEQLLDIRQALAALTGEAFNFVLLNRYRHGADGMGWHRDDEPTRSDLIASVSLGATRRFLLRPEPEKPSVPLDLAHGSLLLMDGRIPHSLPKTRRVIGERVNLSFRMLP